MVYTPPRKEVELKGSGYKVIMRRLTNYDRLRLGLVFEPEVEGSASPGAEEAPGATPPPKSKRPRPEQMEMLVKAIVGSICVHPVGKRIVAELPENLRDGSHISFWDLPEEDQIALNMAHNVWEAELPPATFSDGPKAEANPADGAPDGAVLRDTPQ